MSISLNLQFVTCDYDVITSMWRVVNGDMCHAVLALMTPQNVEYACHVPVVMPHHDNVRCHVYL